MIIQEDTRMSRYRFWVIGVILASGYAVIFTAASAYLNLVGDDLPDWMIAQTWYPPFDEAAIFAPLRIAAAVIIVWAIWQVARGPARTTPPLRSPWWTGGVDGLRRTLYWAAGGYLLLWFLQYIAPSLIPWPATILMNVLLVVLFHPVLTGTRPLFLWLTSIFGAISVMEMIAVYVVFEILALPMSIEWIFVFNLNSVVHSIWLGMILVAQRLDGRWSWRALWPAWANLAGGHMIWWHQLDLPTIVPIPSIFWRIVVQSSGMISALLAVWAVRSAHALADGAVTGAEPYQGGPDGVDVVDGEDGGEEEGVVAGGDDAGGFGFEGGDAVVDEERLGNGAAVVRGAGEE
ncbi:hypothetical protein GCM10009555_080950 [Acrocarpospora macrocephala]|uniref:Uncharacterized protein n=1 Tax=Acrocarpospora macrocephala TaxID=150177 RepID=A0A5M3XA04_9ACTN|nr:hypothetical protein Amac_092710 [Acrocarpospora macrocephala]